MGRQLDPGARSAVGSVRLEGGEFAAEAVELTDRVARGELDADEAVAELLMRRGIATPVR